MSHINKPWKDCISIEGKTMTLSEAKRDGYLELTPLNEGDTLCDEGYAAFALSAHAEEHVSSIDPDTPISGVGSGMPLKDAIRFGWLKPIKAEVIIGYQFIK